jgi:predicted O-methyltransferase YrrM
VEFFRAQQIDARKIMEIGIWNGGSAAFLFEYFRPDRFVAVDILDQPAYPAFNDYVSRKGRSSRLKTYWGTNQANRERLLEIVDAEFNGPMDLIIDDASHEFHATKASFEALYPRLRRGGWYLIEDWIWETMPSFRAPDHPWKDTIGLVRLVQDFIPQIAQGTVRQLTVVPGFAAIQKN